MYFCMYFSFARKSGTPPRWIIYTWEQTLHRENVCVGLAQCYNQGLFPKSKHHTYRVSTFQSLGYVHKTYDLSEIVSVYFQSLGYVHKTYDLSEIVSVYNVRCCGIISVEEFGS